MNVNNNNNLIYFSIPDFVVNSKLVTLLMFLCEKEPEKFYENIVINSIYGSFPCIWNGGRYMDGPVSKDLIVQALSIFKDKGISIRHTFTNCLLNESHLTDALGNTILEISEELDDVGVIVNSPLLKDYISENYPQFYIIQSTTLGLTDIDEINEKSKNNIVIPSYTLNNHFELLKKLEHKENIEILVGETCVDHCSNRAAHHEHISKKQLFYPTFDSFKCPYGCEVKANYYDTITKRDHYISIEDINNKYLPLGFNKFKLSGRGDGLITNIERYVNYFVKPEYKDEMRNKFFNYYF